MSKFKRIKKWIVNLITRVTQRTIWPIQMMNFMIVSQMANRFPRQRTRLTIFLALKTFNFYSQSLLVKFYLISIIHRAFQGRRGVIYIYLHKDSETNILCNRSTGECHKRIFWYVSFRMCLERFSTAKSGIVNNVFSIWGVITCEQLAKIFKDNKN